MTADPTDLNAVAERLDEWAGRVADLIAEFKLKGSARGDLPLSMADLRTGAECVRLVAAIREPSAALVQRVARAMLADLYPEPRFAAVVDEHWRQRAPLARAALRAIDERGAG